MTQVSFIRSEEQPKEQRLSVRRPELSDVDALYRIYGDPRTNVFNPAGPIKSLVQAQAILNGWIEHWTRHGFGIWAIATIQCPETVIGFGGLSHALIGEGCEVHVGYRFAVEAWGKGYATELTRMAIDHGRLHLGLSDIFAFVRPDHFSSRRVLEKAGLIECGLLDDVPGKPPSILYRAIRVT